MRHINTRFGATHREDRNLDFSGIFGALQAGIGLGRASTRFNRLDATNAAVVFLEFSEFIS